MDNVFDKEEFAKNIYVIRHKLGELRPCAGRSDRWEYRVGNFNVVIYAYEMGDVPPKKMESLLRYDKVNVVLNEFNKGGAGSFVSLRDDPRFKNYEPIQYDIIPTPSGKINISNGDNMPILQLCELIRYLYRLSNLTAFM